MIEIQSDSLLFSFPEVHPSAELRISFLRTLRIPDDGRTYPLPPGFENFPLKHVDDYRGTIPAQWLEHGGVMLPMYQSEALWLSFDCQWDSKRDARYPFAIKIAAGKVDAVTGQAWSNELHPTPQDYVVAPIQPWLDGFCVERGTVRQFVAMPLGQGATVEEQVTGQATVGGIQIIAYPMKREEFERRYPECPERYDICCCLSAPDDDGMGLAAGGQLKQEIYKDPFGDEVWDRGSWSRCFVHIANSRLWRDITGDYPPTVPISAEDYIRYGLPWFEYYADDGVPLPGASILKKVKSISSFGGGNLVKYME